MDRPAPTAPPALVDTGRAGGRRTLRFATLSEALADADRLAAAERAGTLKRVGNWTLGQALGHLAAWANYAFDGYPLRAPWFVRAISRLRKRHYLYNGLSAGVKIPRAPAGTHATEPLPLDEGLSRFHQALERLGRAAPTQPNPLFGPLTHDEWIALQLRHAELHLSFFAPTTS